MAAGTTPERPSVKANVTSFVAIAMSEAAISPTPPARVGHASRATTGLGHDQSVSRNAANSVLAGAHTAGTGLPDVELGAEHRARCG